MGDRIKKMKTRCSVPFSAFGTGHLFLICFCRSIPPSFVLVAVPSADYSEFRDLNGLRVRLSDR